MADSTLIENRRRASDQDKRQLSYLMTVSWVIITISVVLVILLADFRRFENTFQKKAIAIEHRLQSHIRQNEAVLEGFAAFLSGKRKLDDASASDYTRNIRQRFPYVFMIEIAEGVSAEDLPALISRQRQKGYADYEVKAYDYEGKRQWRSLPERRRYYPLVFLSPMSEESREVLGLDLGSHDFLYKALQQALNTGHYQTSVPFRLIEGDKAYVMFKPVNGAEDIANQESNQFIVLIVLLAERLQAEIEPLLDERISLLVYHSDRKQSDNSGHLFWQEGSNGFQLLSTTYQVDLEEGRHGFILNIGSNFQISDISWLLVVLAIVVGLLIYIYSRNFIFKRYTRDIKWAKDEARLQFLASYDVLTELPNRRFLVKLLESRLEDSGGKLRLAMLFLDLDLFKQVNDSYGHRMGDVLLQEVARRIKGVVRVDDMASRLGGDEFVVLISDYLSEDNVQHVIEKLREEIEAPYEIEGRLLKIRVSIGVAYYPRDTGDLLNLLHLADKSMYKNKSRRKNLTLVSQSEGKLT